MSSVSFSGSACAAQAFVVQTSSTSASNVAAISNTFTTAVAQQTGSSGSKHGGSSLSSLASSSGASEQATKKYKTSTGEAASAPANTATAAQGTGPVQALRATEAEDKAELAAMQQLLPTAELHRTVTFPTVGYLGCYPFDSFGYERPSRLGPTPNKKFEDFTNDEIDSISVPFRQHNDFAINWLMLSQHNQRWVSIPFMVGNVESREITWSRIAISQAMCDDLIKKATAKIAELEKIAVEYSKEGQLKQLEFQKRELEVKEAALKFANGSQQEQKELKDKQDALYRDFNKYANEKLFPARRAPKLIPELQMAISTLKSTPNLSTYAKLVGLVNKMIVGNLFYSEGKVFTGFVRSSTAAEPGFSLECCNPRCVTVMTWNKERTWWNINDHFVPPHFSGELPLIEKSSSDTSVYAKGFFAAILVSEQISKGFVNYCTVKDPVTGKEHGVTVKVRPQDHISGGNGFGVLNQQEAPLADFGLRKHIKSLLMYYHTVVVDDSVPKTATAAGSAGAPAIGTSHAEVLSLAQKTSDETVKLFESYKY